MRRQDANIRVSHTWKFVLLVMPWISHGILAWRCNLIWSYDLVDWLDVLPSTMGYHDLRWLTKVGIWDFVMWETKWYDMGFYDHHYMLPNKGVGAFPFGVASAPAISLGVVVFQSGWRDSSGRSLWCFCHFGHGLSNFLGESTPGVWCYILR